MGRKLEILTGFFAAFTGLIGLGIALFGDTRTVTDNGAVTLSSLWSRGLDGHDALYLLVMLMAATVIAVASYIHVTRMNTAAMATIWVATAALTVGVLIDLPESQTNVTSATLFTMADTHAGIWLIPAAALGLIAAVSSLVRDFPESPPVAQVHQ